MAKEVNYVIYNYASDRLFQEKEILDKLFSDLEDKNLSVYDSKNFETIKFMIRRIDASLGFIADAEDDDNYE